MKKKVSRLTLHRETILRLDEPKLRTLAGGAVAGVVPLSQEKGCMSPLCVPSYWETCECNGGLN